MKCRHEYVHPRWEPCIPRMRHIVTFQCDCGALGVRSLGETPDPVGMELRVADLTPFAIHVYGPGRDPFDCGDDYIEWSEPSIEGLVQEVATVGGKPDRLELNPDNVEAAIDAGMDVEVVPVDGTQEND